VSISYSEREVFKPEEITLWRRATGLVARIPENLKNSRCHEVARACAKLLNLPVQDGFYGFVDHSWCWTRPVPHTVGRLGFPNILDVYCVGSLPMVRLVDGEHTSLPHVGWAYRPGNARDDIDQERIRELLRAMKQS
jgi:hypothetical protein